MSSQSHPCNMILLRGIPVPTSLQAVVRQDTQAMLSVAQEVLEAAEECGDLVGGGLPRLRSRFAAALWDFLLQVLRHGRQAGRINAVTPPLLH